MTQQFAVTSVQAEAARMAVKRNDERGRESSPELRAIANARRVSAGENDSNGNGG